MNERDIPCPHCATPIPVKCVRCRDCGGFLRPEMARFYQRLKEVPVPPAGAAINPLPTQPVAG